MGHNILDILYLNVTGKTRSLHKLRSKIRPRVQTIFFMKTHWVQCRGLGKWGKCRDEYGSTKKTLCTTGARKPSPTFSCFIHRDVLRRKMLNLYVFWPFYIVLSRSDKKYCVWSSDSVYVALTTKWVTNSRTYWN